MLAKRSGVVLPSPFAGLQKVLTLTLGGLVVAVGFVAAAWELYSFSVTIAVPDLPNVVVAAPAPMGQPDLSTAPPLPDAADLEAAAGQARELLAAGGPLPVWADGCDPVALAWAAAAPAAPARRVGAWELYRGKLMPGTPVRLRGEFTGEALPSGTGPWRRAALGIDAGAVVEVLVPAVGELPARAEIEGIFLGRDPLPFADGSKSVAVVAARSVARDLSAPVPSELPAARDWPALAADPRWQAIDDHSMVDDAAPYYAMLGIIAADAAVAEAPPLLNAVAGSVYDDAPTHRGRPVQVVGTVIRAWEDPLVAVDHPAGIKRVVRVLMHHRDAGPVTEMGPDGKTRIARMNVLRLYELALISDGPLPTPGQELLGQGRFLRLVARPIIPRPNHVEAGDRAYAMLVVARSVSVLTNPGLGQLPRWRLGVMAVCAVLGVVLVRHAWRQRREYRALAADLAAGRRQRAEVVASRNRSV